MLLLTYYDFKTKLVILKYLTYSFFYGTIILADIRNDFLRWQLNV